MGYIDAGLVTPALNDAAQAAANVTKLQAALDQGGDVYFIGRGIAYIDAALAIGDDTRLTVDEGLTIKNASSAPGNLLVTKQFAAARANPDAAFTPIVLSWSSGDQFSVNWTAHGKSVGNEVYLEGSVQSYYNGVFQVISVTDANNFKLSAQRQPLTAPTVSAILNKDDGSLTPVTLSWSSGTTVTVNLTAHGQSVSDAFAIKGVMPSIFNGLFTVASVPDANHFTYILGSTPSGAPSATARAMKANRNIRVISGAWDYSYPTVVGGAGLTPDAFALIGAFARNIRFENISVIQASKYALCFGGVRDYGVDGLYCPTTNSDGVKVYGPALNGLVKGITGFYGDDVCTIQNAETIPPYLGYNFTQGGDIIGFKGQDFDAHTSVGSQAGIYEGPSGIIQDIEYDGMHGFSTGTSVCKISGSGGTVSNISLKNVDGLGPAAVTIQGGTVDILNLSKVIPNLFDTTTGPAIVVLSTGTVGLLNVYDAGAAQPGFPQFNTNYYIAVDGTVGCLSLFGGGFLSSSAPDWAAIVRLNGGAIVRQVSLFGGKYQAATRVVWMDQNVIGKPNLLVNGAYIDANCLLETGADCELTITGCQLDSVFNGFLRVEGTNAPNIEWSMSGNSFVGGFNAYYADTSTGSGPVVNPHGWDIQVDIADMNRVTGNYCTATGAQGTIPAGSMVACQGSSSGSWFAMSDPTKVY